MKLKLLYFENETIYTEHLIQLLYQWQNNRSCSLMIDTVCSAAELYHSSIKNIMLSFLSILYWIMEKMELMLQKPSALNPMTVIWSF